MAIRDVPWRLIRYTFYLIRSILFTRDKADPQVQTPTKTTSEVRDILRRHHFGNGKLVSYHYKGEGLNMARPFYKDDKWEDYQTHVRGFDHSTENGRQYATWDVHEELDPRSDGQSKAHLKGVNQSDEPAIQTFIGILNEEGIEHTRID